MANYPKPHFVKGKGKWLACYGNNSKGSKFRAQIVVAEDENIFTAHCKYLERLDPQSNVKARLAAAKRGKSNMPYSCHPKAHKGVYVIKRDINSFVAMQMRWGMVWAGLQTTACLIGLVMLVAVSD